MYVCLVWWEQLGCMEHFQHESVWGECPVLASYPQQQDKQLVKDVLSPWQQGSLPQKALLCPLCTHCTSSFREIWLNSSHLNFSPQCAVQAVTRLYNTKVFDVVVSCVHGITCLNSHKCSCGEILQTSQVILWGIAALDCPWTFLLTLFLMSIQCAPQDAILFTIWEATHLLCVLVQFVVVCPAKSCTPTLLPCCLQHDWKGSVSSVLQLLSTKWLSNATLYYLKLMLPYRAK